MKRHLLTILMTLAVAFAVLPSLSVFADETAAAAQAVVPGTVPGAEPASESDPDAPQEPEPDPEGTVSFENLDRRVRGGDLNALIVGESIASLEELDYDQMREYFRRQLNDIAEAQWAMVSMASSLQQIDPNGANSMRSSADAMGTVYDSIRVQYDDIKDGTMQKDNADRLRMLYNMQDQVVIGAETLYVGISEAEAGRETLLRGMDNLDRNIAEMELRYSLGQISQLQLAQLQDARVALESQMKTLDTNIIGLKERMELLLGEEPVGEISLAPLPEITSEALDTMDPEADLDAAKEASYDLYTAAQDLKDARKAWNEARVYDAPYALSHFRYVQGLHTWQAAQYTYDNTVQEFERRFRALYLQVKDYDQKLGASEYALAAEERNYAVNQLKYELGNMSQNQLAAAMEDVSSAQDSVNTAKRNLFSAWNNYRWAVERGILN